MPFLSIPAEAPAARGGGGRGHRRGRVFALLVAGAVCPVVGRGLFDDRCLRFRVVAGRGRLRIQRRREGRVQRVRAAKKMC